MKTNNFCPSINPARKDAKKAARTQRINNMVGVYWDTDGFKKIGKSRFLRRRMWPNAKQLMEYNSYLPF